MADEPNPDRARGELGGRGLITSRELQEILDTDDAFRIAIKFHQAIEELLNLAISERLVEPHVLEVKRLGFAIKIDIAVGLGIVPAVEREALVAANRIRNRFAHDARAVFGDEQAREFYRTWPPLIARFTEAPDDVLKNPLAVLQYGFLGLYVALWSAVSHVRDEKVAMRILTKVAQEVADPSLKTGGDRDKPANERFEERLAAERKQREDQGLL